MRRLPPAQPANSRCGRRLCWRCNWRVSRYPPRCRSTARLPPLTALASISPAATAITSQTSYGPLHYNQASQAASFSFTSCNGSAFSNNGHYAAKLVSATVEDGRGQPISNVQLQPSSTVAVNSAYAYAASSRQGDAVCNGLIKEYGFQEIGSPPSLSFGCGLFRHANGTVYRQRLLNGAWQTMLSRTTTTRVR